VNVVWASDVTDDAAEAAWRVTRDR